MDWRPLYVSTAIKIFAASVKKFRKKMKSMSTCKIAVSINSDKPQGMQKNREKAIHRSV